MNIQRPCAQPNCSQLVKRGYCPKHQAQRDRIEQRVDQERGNSSFRGYNNAWKKCRAQFLAIPKNQICADCQKAPTQEVHHLQKVKQFPELRLVFSNLIGLCRRCHRKRTRKGE